MMPMTDEADDVTEIGRPELGQRRAHATQPLDSSGRQANLDDEEGDRDRNTASAKASSRNVSEEAGDMTVTLAFPHRYRDTRLQDRGWQASMIIPSTPSARVAPGTGAGSRLRTLRPGTRPPLVHCRCPRVYELARGRICHTAQNAGRDSRHPKRGDGRRADESLRPRSASLTHGVTSRGVLGLAHAGATRHPCPVQMRGRAV